MSLSDVCKVVNIDWKTAKDIDIYYTKKQIASLKDITPTKIGIDEVAYEKGHWYLTVVRDLDLGKVIWVGLNRNKETLDEFFDELGHEKKAMIEVAVVDMWDAYIASLKENCPYADIVFDKFHVVKLVNKALDEVRKREFAKADEKQRKYMKRKRFLILKRKKNLDEEQTETLDELMKQNDILYRSYLLKEQIGDILDEEEPSSATKRLNRWLRNVSRSAIKPFIKCAKTIRRYLYGIINYFKHGYTNAGSEGFNTKINIIKRRAYGYWHLEYFILKIFQACGVMKL
jgi:transposase